MPPPAAFGFTATEAEGAALAVASAVGAADAVAVGSADAVTVGAVDAIALAACGLVLGRGPVYGVAVVVAAALLVYEHSLVRRRGLAAIDKAFFDVNAWVSVLFFVLVTVDELLRRR